MTSCPRFIFKTFKLNWYSWGQHWKPSNMQFWSCSNSFDGPKLRIQIDLEPRDHKLHDCTKLHFRKLSIWIKGNKSRDNKFRGESQSTKTALTCVWRHVTNSFMDHKSYPRVNWSESAYFYLRNPLKVEGQEFNQIFKAAIVARVVSLKHLTVSICHF